MTISKSLLNKTVANRYMPFALALVVALLDRITKIAARDSLSAYIGVPVIPGFLRLVHTENPGAAFSFLSEGNPILRTFVLIGVSAVVLCLVASVLWKHHPNFATPLVRLGLAFVLGGAAGNLYDRVFYGTVTDFIEVYHRAWSFPVFNVADSAITIGAILLLFDMLILHRTSTPPGAQTAHK
jgi:signal peptidase II